MWKKALWWSRVNIMFTRITLTRYTTCYFFLALASCITQVVLHYVTYADSSMAAELITDIAQQCNLPGLSIKLDDMLQVCNGIPGEAGTTCTPIAGDLFANSTAMHNDSIAVSPKMSKRHMTTQITFDPNGQMTGVTVANPEEHLPSTTLSLPCVQSLHWFRDVLRDGKREDVVGVFFHLWIFTVSAATILNESIPHLLTALAAHVVGILAAGLRIRCQAKMNSLYYEYIVSGTCGVDVLGSWFSLRTKHTIPIFVIGGITLLAISYLSWILYKVYEQQSFCRVGAPPHIHRIYKFVLFLSVCLQLGGFVVIAATGIWIDKISLGSLHSFASHIDIFKAEFGVTAALELPWLVSGWISVRRERRNLFLAFVVIGLILLGISTAMFASPLYFFIFMTWPFFAALTVTSYICLMAIFLLAVVCRLHFGRGLAHFLHVQDTLEHSGFTAVYFSKDPEKSPSGSIPRFSVMSHEKHMFWEKPSTTPVLLLYLTSVPHSRTRNLPSTSIQTALRNRGFLLS